MNIIELSKIMASCLCVSRSKQNGGGGGGAIVVLYGICVV